MIPSFEQNWTSHFGPSLTLFTMTLLWDYDTIIYIRQCWWCKPLGLFGDKKTPWHRHQADTRYQFIFPPLLSSEGVESLVERFKFLVCFRILSWFRPQYSISLQLMWKNTKKIHFNARMSSKCCLIHCSFVLQPEDWYWWLIQEAMEGIEDCINCYTNLDPELSLVKIF